MRIKLPAAAKTELNKIVKQLVDSYRPEKILLFGSYAYGEPSADSDLDLLIIKKTSESFMDRLVNVRQIVSDPKRSIPFQPLVLTSDELKERLAIGDQFVEEILSKEKYFTAVSQRLTDRL